MEPVTDLIMIEMNVSFFVYVKQQQISAIFHGQTDK